MFLELIAVIFAGFALAGLAMLLNRLTGGRLPRWFAPVAAGIGMIVVTVVSEYGWYGRTLAALPEGLVVAEEVPHQSLYQPWTYAVPYVDRFAAVDIGTMRSHPEKPGQHMGEIFFFGRWAPVSKLSALFDCPGLRRAVLAEGSIFESDGTVTAAEWVAVEPSDPLLNTVCETRG